MTPHKSKVGKDPFIEPMRTCANCLHYAVGEPGQCRRRAPVMAKNGWGKWPAVQPTNLCGEHAWNDEMIEIITNKILRDIPKITNKTGPTK